MATKPTKRPKGGNPDLAAWHDKLKKSQREAGGSVQQAAVREKKAEMRFHRKKKTPGTGN